MKKLTLYLFLVFAFFLATCRNFDLDLDNDNSTEQLDCRIDYPNPNVIRLKSTPNFTLSYEKWQDTYRVIKIEKGSIIHKLNYEDGLLRLKESYLGQTDSLISFEEYIYTDTKRLYRKNLFLRSIVNQEFSSLGYITYLFREDGFLKVENYHGQNHPNEEYRILHSCSYEWEDCNLVKKRIHDENGEVGYEFLYEYDDKFNPYNLVVIEPQIPKYFTRSNVIRSEIVVVRNGNYSGGILDFTNHVSNFSYDYNEFDLPTKISNRMNDSFLFQYE